MRSASGVDRVADLLRISTRPSKAVSALRCATALDGRPTHFAHEAARTSSRTRRARAGFSLIEVMCAILILGIGLVGLTHGITTALGSNKDAEIQTAAALLAASQIETLRAEGYVIEGESEGEGDGDLAGYTWAQSVVATQPEGLYEVTVTIRNTGTGAELFELKTMLFDPPVIREPEQEQNPNQRNRRRQT
jgi:prepilin-type N-terminal cleavage/methylation domain-containing protein